jgi:uncharacterized protein YkuJ
MNIFHYFSSSATGATLRIIQVDKSRVLFYSYDDFEIVTIDIFDTRQDRNKRKC